MSNALSDVVADRDRDWILALAYAAGLDSGLEVPIVPDVNVVRKFLHDYAVIAKAEGE